MKYKIVYSDEALYKLSKIELFVLFNFNKNVLDKFKIKLSQEVNYLSQYPFSSKRLDDNYFKKVLTKHYSILFMLSDFEIIILDFIISKSANNFYY